MADHLTTHDSTSQGSRLAEGYRAQYSELIEATDAQYLNTWSEVSNWTSVMDEYGDDYTRNLMTTPAELTGMMPQYDTIRIVWIISICGITLGVMAIVLNIVFLIGMRSLKDRSTAYHPFMKNLSVADIMASLSFLVTQNWPRGPFAHIEPSKEFMLVQGLPYLFRSTPWMFFTAYLLTLSCLTINQYVAVCRPWKYSELVSRRMVSISLIVVWSISCLQIVVPLIVLLVLWNQEDKTQATMTLFKVSNIEIQVWMAVFALSTVFNIWLNFLVYCKIRHLKIQRRTPGTGSSNLETLGIRMKQEAFVTVSLLLAASVFCRLPFPLMGLLGINLQRLLTLRTAQLLGAVVVLLLYVNFFVDPIIYVIRMKEVRRAYARFFDSCARCCKKSSYISHYRTSLRLLTSRVVETTIADFSRKPSTSTKLNPPTHIHQYVHVHVELPPESAI